MAGNVITAPADPAITAAIELLKLVADPVKAEAKLKEIADAQAASARVMAEAIEKSAELGAREAAAGSAIAEAGKAIEQQRRVEADNKRRADELLARERALSANLLLFETSKTEATQRIDALGRQFEERERTANAHLLEQAAKLADRELGVAEREKAVREGERAVAAREEEHRARVARIKAAAE